MTILYTLDDTGRVHKMKEGPGDHILCAAWGQHINIDPRILLIAGTVLFHRLFLSLFMNVSAFLLVNGSATMQWMINAHEFLLYRSAV